MNIVKIRPLADLPKIEGFKFQGICEYRSPIECRVVKNEKTGRFGIAGDVIRSELIGWIPA